MMLWRLWRRTRALARMGTHERWRAALMSDPQMTGRIYCYCDRCERDNAIYVANGGPDYHGSRARMLRS